MNEEIWKDIPGYEGLYQVSSLGRIKSLDRVVRHNYGGNKLNKGKILKLTPHHIYLRCTLYDRNGKRRMYFVHRVVYRTFIGIIPKGMQVNHIDECGTNNTVSNLNLMDCKANVNWGTGTNRAHIKQINNNNSKEILQFDLDGNLINVYKSIREINRKYSYDRKSIINCCKGKNGFKTAYGYKWKYKNESS